MTECLQRTAVACRDERHSAIPLPGRRAGYSEAALAKLNPSIHVNLGPTDMPENFNIQTAAVDDGDLYEDFPFGFPLGFDSP